MSPPQTEERISIPICRLGTVIYDPHNHSPVHESSVEVEEATNVVAELEAVHGALQWTAKNYDALMFDGGTFACTLIYNTFVRCF